MMDTSKQLEGEELPSEQNLRRWVKAKVDGDIGWVIETIEDVFDEDTVALDSPIEKENRKKLYKMEEHDLVRTKTVQHQQMKKHFHWILRCHDDMR
jgi:hypothetical protein